MLESMPLIPSRPVSFRDEGIVETTTVKTVTTPPEKKNSFLDKLVPKFLKPTDTGPTPPPDNQTIQVRIHPGGDVDVDVGTGAKTAGNATTVGGNGARTAALGRIPSEPQGRKAGIRPIPISKWSIVHGPALGDIT